MGILIVSGDGAGVEGLQPFPIHALARSPSRQALELSWILLLLNCEETEILQSFEMSVCFSEIAEYWWTSSSMPEYRRLWLYVVLGLEKLRSC